MALYYYTLNKTVVVKFVLHTHECRMFMYVHPVNVGSQHEKSAILEYFAINTIAVGCRDSLVLRERGCNFSWLQIYCAEI